MPGLNLLPWREKEREAKKKQFFALLGGAVVGSAAMVLLGNLYMQSSIENQQSRNTTLENEIAAVEQQIKKIEELDKTRQSLLDRMKVIDTLQSTRPAIVHLFDEMVNALPKGMYLTHLQQSGTLVHLDGKAESYARVSSYMNKLDASQWLNSSNLNIISTAGGGKDGQLMLRDFKLDVTQLLKTGDAAKQDASAPKKPEGAK